MNLNDKIKIESDNETNQTVILLSTPEGEKEIFRLNAPLQDFVRFGSLNAFTLRNAEKRTMIEVQPDNIKIHDNSGQTLLPQELADRTDLPAVTNAAYYNLKTGEYLHRTDTQHKNVYSSSILDMSRTTLYVSTNTSLLSSKGSRFIYIKYPQAEKKIMQFIYSDKTHELHFGKRSLLEEGYEITHQKEHAVRRKLSAQEGMDAYFNKPRFKMLEKHNIKFSVGFDNRAAIAERRTLSQQKNGASLHKEIAQQNTLLTPHPFWSVESKYVEQSPGIHLSKNELHAFRGRPRKKSKIKKLFQFLGILHVLAATTSANMLSPQIDKVSTQGASTSLLTAHKINSRSNNA